MEFNKKINEAYYTVKVLNSNPLLAKNLQASEVLVFRITVASHMTQMCLRC